MRIWLVFLFGLVTLFSSSQKDIKFRNYSINDGLSQSSVTTIIQDKLNSLWIGTQDGLNRFDGTNFEVFSSDKTQGLSSSYIFSSFSNEPNSLWFGTNKGLTRYDVQLNKFESFHYKKEKSLHVVDIDAGEGNILWISTLEYGILSFDPVTKNSRHSPLFYHTKKSVPSVGSQKTII